MRKKNTDSKSSELRKKAEAFLQSHATPEEDAATTAADALKLVHELQVHQVELEMQNEELRRTEQALKRSYDQYLSLYDFSPVGYVTLDVNGQVLSVNLTLAQQLGADRALLVGQPFLPRVAPAEQNDFLRFAAAARASDRRLALETTLLRADGRLFPAHLDAVSVESEEGPLHLRIGVSDTTELRAALDALRQSEEHFRTLVQHIPDVTWTTDVRGRLTYISSNVKRLTGYTAAEILEGGPGFWQEHVHPIDLEAAREAFRGLPREGGASEFEFRFRHRNGNEIWILSRSMRTFEVGGQIRTDGILTDVTVRRLVEDHLRQGVLDLERHGLEQTAQVRRLEHQRDVMTLDVSAGRRAATVIHEINNPLAGILNSFRLIRKGIGPEHPQYRLLLLVHRELERLARLVRQLYGSEHPQSPNLTQCDPRQVLDEVVEIMVHHVKARQLKVFIHNQGNNQILMSESDLKQVLYNLYSNAIKASYAGSEIHFHLRPMDSLMHILVEDHGIGIPADKLPRIFESFADVSGEPPASHLHIGLSTVRTLVEAAQGHLEIKSQEGLGTSVSLWIPIANNTGYNP